MSSDLLSRARRLEAYAALDPANVELLFDLADTWHHAGEHGKALSVLERAEQAGLPPARLGPLKGRLLMAQGRWHDAVQLYESALHDAPASAALLANLGYSCWAAGDTARAVEWLMQAAALDPADPDIRCHLALALEETHLPAEAAQALEQALALQPTHEKALTMLARLRLDAGALEQAAALAGRCIAAHPTHAAGWQLRGQVSLFEMDAASAVKSLRQALDLEPADVDTRVLLAQAAMLQGRVRHARTLLQEAAALEPSNDQAQCMLGWACAGEDDIDGAEAAFERALDIEPSADALSGRACVALGRAAPERAREAAEQALALEPDHALARLLLSRVQALAGQDVQAGELLQEVLRSTPFGPLGSDVRSTLSGAAQQPMVRRLQRRAALARRNSSTPSQGEAT